MSSTASTQSNPSLLVADDEAEIGDIVQAVAEDLGFKTTCVTDGAEVVAVADKLRPDVIALDLRMPGADGVEIIRELGNRNCKAKIILMSGMDQRTLSSVQSLGREHNLDIVSTLTKPMSVDAIESALQPLKDVPDEPIEIKTSHDHAAALMEFGLDLKFEPEFILRAPENSAAQRVRVFATFRLDDGDLLSGKRLRDWARQCGIAKGLSKRILAQSLETLRVWANQDFCPELSVKLDATLFTDLGMPDIIAGLVDSYHVPRELICITIEEDALEDKLSTVSEVLSRLRIKGFKLSVCAAGEGETILPVLDALPIDHLVVDMSALNDKKNFLNDMEVEFLYSSLTSVTNHKGIAACAINVDSNDQLEFVKRCKFNTVRGAQIGKPESADAILPLYTEGKFAEN